MGAHSYDDLHRHVGHKIECVVYGDRDVANVAVECETCNEVLMDFDSGKDVSSLGFVRLFDEAIQLVHRMAENASIRHGGWDAYYGKDEKDVTDLSKRLAEAGLKRRDEDGEEGRKA